MKNKKWAMFALFIILFIIIASGIVYYFYSKGANPPENKLNEADNTIIKDIDPSKQPLLYDFLDSTLGRRTDLDTSIYHDSYAILIYDEDINKEPGRMMVQKCEFRRALPSSCSAPIVIDNIKLENWKDITSRLDDFKEGEFKFSEENYAIYIITNEYSGKGEYPRTYHSKDKLHTWAGIDLNLLNYPKSSYQINDYLGIPSDWIRKEPYITYIKSTDTYNTDITDKFFDRFNLGEKFFLEKIEGEVGELLPAVREVEVIGADLFKFNNGIKWQPLGLEQMNIQLASEGYELIEPRR